MDGHDGPPQNNDREVRRALDSCYNQGCKKSRRNGKMYTCTRCKVAHYCSPECQGADWPAHKRACKAIQNENAVVERMNAVVKGHSAEPGVPTLLPGDLADEFRDFFKHFQHYLLVAALNAFRAARNSSEIVGWEDGCFYVTFQRRTDFPPSTPPWARFRMEMGRRMLFSAVELLVEGHPQYSNFKTTRAELLEQARRNHPDGGLLVIWMCCTSDELPAGIHAPVGKIFTPSLARSKANFIPPDLEPVEWLKFTVEKMSTEAFR